MVPVWTRVPSLVAPFLIRRSLSSVCWGFLVFMLQGISEL